MTTTHRHEPREQTVLSGIALHPSAPHVLIVDDHPAIQEMLCSALALAGYHTTACAGRQALLTWIDQRMPSSDCYALILVDLSIPDTHAADFLLHLRARLRDSYGILPQIIVLTTNKKVQEDLSPQEQVVLKPFHIRDLLDLMQQMISCASLPIPSANR